MTDAPEAEAEPNDKKDGAARSAMYGDRQKALDLLARCQRDARRNTSRQARDRADLLNLKMYRGGEDNQWLVWDGNANTYVTRPTDGDAGLPAWFFRATSPLLANKIDGITAIQNQSQPAKNWYAARDDDESRAAADVAERADPVLLEEIDYPHNLRPRLNTLVSLTNLAAIVLTYDTSEKHGMDDIPLLQCAECHQFVQPLDAPNPEDPCPECGGQLDWARYPEGHQMVGQSITMPYPKGKIVAEQVSSFELSMPQSASQAHEDYVPWLATHQRWAIEDLLAQWPQLKESHGARETSSGTGKATEQAYADQMRHLSSPVQAGSPTGAGTTTGNGPVVWRLWHDPIDDEEFTFPDGVFLTVLEGSEELLEFGPLEYRDDQDRPTKNILIRQFAPTPGSPWGKPPADDLVPLQKQLNLAQALAFMILMHHASPRTFIPSTVTLYDKTTGMPGKDVGYRSMVPGDKPHIEPGQSFPEGLKWFLEFIIQMFDTVSKLNAVLMGTKPQGDHTLGEVEILQERGFAAFQAPLEQLVAFEKRLSLKLLWMTRQCGWSERYARLMGDNGQWKLEAFTGADLEGHVMLDIDLATAWPKSPMLTNLRVAKAFELGVLNPQDPEVAEEYLRMNDLLDFKSSTDADRDQVARQLDSWKHATDPQQIEPPQTWWRLDYHYYRKTQFLKSEEFERLQQENPPLAGAMIAHVQQLQLMLAPPAPTEPTEPGKGDSGALNHAVTSGAIRPAAGPGTKNALPQLVHAGAVRPAGTGAAQQQHEHQKRGPHSNDLLHAGVIRPAHPAGGNPTSAAPTRPGASA